MRELATHQPPPYAYTPFQELVHSLPPGTSKFLGGGRGGAKSELIAQMVAVAAIRHGPEARILMLRKGPFKAVNDLVEGLRKQFNMRWGSKGHSYNRSEHLWTLPTDTYLEIGVLPDGRRGREYYEEVYQGRTFTHIFADEAQVWARAEVLDLLLSNLRGSIPTEMTLGANPGGLGHQWLAQRFVSSSDPWKLFRIEKEIRIAGQKIETSRTWMSCPSTYRDNPYNGPGYRANLAASCGHDDELLKAWITGSWKISRGAFFAGVLDNPKIEIAWPDPSGWGGWIATDCKFWLAFDHGSAAPATCYVMAKSPGAIGPDERYYPPGSILVLDEWVCYRPSDLGLGFNWDVTQISGPILALAKRWRIEPRGVADDACFGLHGHKAGSIADEYGYEGIVWRQARKGRRAPRFLRMKRLLAACGEVEKPGLYVSKRCEYWWATVPFLVHDPADPEVVLKCATDHGLDATSYGLEGGVASGGVTSSIS